MVGDWQHAEGPLMRPRMSSDRRIGRLPSHPLRYETSLSEPAATFMDSLAYDEARSILADVEDRAMGMAGHRPTRGDMGAAGCALRDCLAVFIGQTFPGEVC